MVEDRKPIYYFGYGPIINPVVRKRRGSRSISEQAAMLPEYRLTFAYGGGVNAIKQRGYEVYGVLLSFDTHEEWENFQEFDAGYNLDEVLVYPLTQSGDPMKVPVKAFTFVYDREYSDSDKENAYEKLPQERYLELIASGMRAYGINEDYIEDHIMSVPYTPKTKPQNFKTFPQRKPVLPRINFQKYQEHLCRNAARGEIYFVIGRKVIAVDSRENTANPCAKWLHDRVHGLPDCTLTVHRTVVDPDLPMVDDPKDITPLHVAWAENHFVEWMGQGGLSGTAIFELIPDRSCAASTTLPRRIFSFRLRCPFLRTRDPEPTRALRRAVGSESSLLNSHRSDLSAGRTSRAGNSTGSSRYVGFSLRRSLSATDMTRRQTLPSHDTEIDASSLEDSS
jgi:hypothetical protein